MKLITAAILFVFFLSCKSGVKDSQYYLFFRDSAAASPLKTDTTLLTFRFGMKKAEVANKLKELEADSTIFYDQNKYCYSYMLKGEGKEAEEPIYCSISPVYNKGELYMIHFSSYKKGNGIIDSNVVADRMYSFLEKKYGPCSLSFRPDKNASPYNVWFINNEEFMIWKTKEGATLQCADLTRELERERFGFSPDYLEIHRIWDSLKNSDKTQDSIKKK